MREGWAGGGGSLGGSRTCEWLVRTLWNFLGTHIIATHPRKYLGHDLESFVVLGRIPFDLFGFRGLLQNPRELGSF